MRGERMRGGSIIVCGEYPNNITINGHSSSSSSNDFDVIIFTQLWPQTVCLYSRQTTNSSYCNLPEEEKWTIHGIWPSQYHKFTPADCNPSLSFDPSLLENIKEELNTKWIFVDNKTHPELFWKHEWDKHGTCSTDIDCVSTQQKYFEKGLDLFNNENYNAKNILKKAKILSGRQYHVKTILKKVNRILGARIYVDCVKNKETNEQYFHEIRICFDKSFNLTDCDGIKNFPTNCDRLKNVIYPKTNPDYNVL
ncbi:ribonuclease Oy-like [Belonocnema kinseyi]|uniref:ribonuclease Oy-like n=1 Tax=Belonocnema kinseyi TaxID=2817044 RepID=UPI00143CCBC3|nr:ribonuclease Oy-like [Belonocnema kinseyi]